VKPSAPDITAADGRSLSVLDTALHRLPWEAHPRDLGEVEVSAFVSHLAARGVSASTQNQSLSAVLFLYDVVLGRRLEWMAHIVRAQRPARLPVVLSRAEVATPAAETVCVSRTDALDDVLRQYGMTEDGDWP